MVASAFALAATIVAVPSALAAYTSPKLEVRNQGNSIVIKVSQAEADDPTAAAVILAPEGTQVTTTQAPGALLGQIEVLVIATAAGNAQLPISGQLVVAQPGQVSPETIAACLEGSTPTAIWMMALSAAGQAINLPVFVLVEDGAVGIFVCLPTPGQLPFGVKLVTAEFTLNGVFTQTPGIWISAWVPYDAAGAINAAGAVISPAAVLPGAVSAVARRARRGPGATVTGRVTQGGAITVSGVTVTIFGGDRANRMRRLGRVRTGQSGAYTFRARGGTFFRASVSAAGGDAAFLCEAIAESIAPLPCVNATINGFTAQSRVVRKR